MWTTTPTEITTKQQKQAPKSPATGRGLQQNYQQSVKLELNQHTQLANGVVFGIVRGFAYRAVFSITDTGKELDIIVVVVFGHQVGFPSGGVFGGAVLEGETVQGEHKLVPRIVQAHVEESHTIKRVGSKGFTHTRQ